MLRINFSNTLLILLFLSSYTALYGAKSAKGKVSEVRIALSSAPSNLNPFFSTDSNSQNINRLVHLALVDLERFMRIQCKLCLSYQEVSFRPKYVVRFTLKKDQTFWDGQAIQAADVKRAIEYYQEAKKLKSIFRFAFSAIEKVTVLSPYQVELTFKSFRLDHLPNLSLLKIVRLKNLDESGSPLGRSKLNEIIGAGSYRFGAIRPLSVELLPVRPQEKRPILHFKVVRDETTLALKLIGKHKEIDLSVANISPRKYLWLKKQKQSGLKFWELSGVTYTYIGINHKRKRLKDRRIRKALSYLIPRRKMRDYKLKGTVQLANALFAPAFKDLYIDRPIDHYNPEAAEKLFIEAGYQKNQKGLWVKEGTPLHLDWKVHSNRSTMERVRVIASYFERFGIQVTALPQEWGTYMRSFKKGNYDLVIGNWIGFTGGEMLQNIFHSKSLPPRGRNRGHYFNSQIDALLDQTLDEFDIQKRNALFKEATTLAFNDYVYLNLWHRNVIWIGRSCLKNIQLYPTESLYPLLDLKNECID